MGERKAYTTVEAARAEAAHRFGPEWPKLDRLLQQVEAESRLRDADRWEARIAEAGAVLKRALPLVREARALASSALAMKARDDLFDDIPLPDERMPDLPADLETVLEHLRRARDVSARATRKDIPQGKLRFALVRAAIKAGVSLPAKEPAAAWSYAFVALGLDEPVEASRAKDENRYAWRLRLVQTRKLIASAKRSRR